MGSEFGREKVPLHVNHAACGWTKQTGHGYQPVTPLSRVFAPMHPHLRLSELSVCVRERTDPNCLSLEIIVIDKLLFFSVYRTS